MVLRESVEGRESAVEEQEPQLSGAKDTQETCSIEMDFPGLRRPTPVCI